MGKFYTFNQNNSGGSFIDNEDVCEFVIIEADNYEHANWLAEKEYGLYFDGCAQGMDCSCCGDRWSEQWNENGDEEPMIYDTSVRLAVKTRFRKQCIIYYQDGRKEKILFR